jgi:hypothetical protein
MDIFFAHFGKGSTQSPLSVRNSRASKVVQQTCPDQQCSPSATASAPLRAFVLSSPAPWHVCLLPCFPRPLPPLPRRPSSVSRWGEPRARTVPGKTPLGNRSPRPSIPFSAGAETGVPRPLGARQGQAAGATASAHMV